MRASLTFVALGEEAQRRGSSLPLPRQCGALIPAVVQEAKQPGARRRPIVLPETISGVQPLSRAGFQLPKLPHRIVGGEVGVFLSLPDGAVTEYLLQRLQPPPALHIHGREVVA